MNQLEIYLYFWITAVTLAFFILYWNRRSYSFLQKSYWSFILEPWKFTTFIIATFLITVVAPYSGDPTWDYFDSIIISFLTYILAPWSVATIYRCLKFHQNFDQLYVALCFFFIPCWTYDYYILIRDGSYPPTWYSNLYLSGGIIFIAGLFWNLFWEKNRGTTFAFLLNEWPPTQKTPFRKVFLICVFLSMPVIASVGWFVYMYLFR